MIDNQLKEPKRPFGAERPFPWRCRHCGKSEVVMTTVRYDPEVRHDGRLYSFTIPGLDIPVCQACGEKVFTEKVDEQINAALRSHLHLLTQEEMRTALDRINMTQKVAVDHLGIAEATLSRWMTGTRIQSRAMDNLLRVFFAFPQVRNALNGDAHDPQLGTIEPCQGNFSARAKNPSASAKTNSSADFADFAD
jgi:putative zinc finger/helix-turn-helix YgiT family protein